MFRLTISTLDDEFVAPLQPGLEREGLQVVRFTPAEGNEPDPAAAPDVLLLDWRHAVPVSRPPEVQAWSDATRLAVLRPADTQLLGPTQELDDFILAPVHEAELIARVQLVLWRHGRALTRNTLEAGDLVVDTSNYQVFEGGRSVSLTFKEFELLRFLMTHNQQVFTRETLLNRVWGYNYYGGSRTVDVHIRRLRSKLEAGGQRYVETVRNVGYRFALPLR
ncbi:MAG: response regulator transcription factor [Chloroflexi bacterium]|nr:response regulator transcription factor [Chloroflexota bacterium]